MGTRLVRFVTEGQGAPRWGVLKQEQVFPLSIEADHHRDVMEVYFSDRAGFDASIAETGIATDSVEFQAPLSRRIQLFAQGIVLGFPQSAHPLHHRIEQKKG